MLPKRQRSLLVPDSDALYAWALDMMRLAGQAPATLQELAAWRAELLLAMLASRGRRLRSMTLLRIGRELVLHDLRYWIELKPEQTKIGKSDRFNLLEDLTPYVEGRASVVS